MRRVPDPNAYHAYHAYLDAGALINKDPDQADTKVLPYVILCRWKEL